MARDSDLQEMDRESPESETSSVVQHVSESSSVAQHVSGNSSVVQHMSDTNEDPPDSPSRDDLDDLHQTLKSEVESQIRLIKQAIQSTVTSTQSTQRDLQRNQIKQDLLKALLPRSKSQLSDVGSPVEEVKVKTEGRPDVTFGKPGEFGAFLGKLEAEEEVSMANIGSKQRQMTAEIEREVPTLPHTDSLEPEIRPNRRMEFDKPRHRPSQSPRPVGKSPEEDGKGRVIDESKYRRHKNLPKLVYSKPSNRKLIKNAIIQVCLAGEAYKSQREEVLKLIDESGDVGNFIIVFRGELGRQDLKALYEYDSATEVVRKLYGPGMWPEVLEPGVVHSYYRYDSGAKEFRQLQCHGFSIATDAVVLKIGQKVAKNALF